MSGSIGVQRREAPSKTRADALAQLDCLQGAPSRDLLRLAHMCTLRAFPPGTQLLNERTPGEFLYLVLRGTVSLTLHDRAGHEVLIGVLNRGDCFGEGPLFSQLSPLERAGIAGLLQPHQYPRGVAIIHEGEPGDALYLIESGQVVVE